MVCNLSLIVVGVAIIIVIVVVVVCVKKGVCAKSTVGVSPNGGLVSNNQPPQASMFTGQYQNPLPPTFTIHNPRQSSFLGYPYPQPPNYNDFRLPPINRVTEININEDKPPSYEPFINQNSTISVNGGFENPVLPASVYQNLQN